MIKTINIKIAFIFIENGRGTCGFYIRVPSNGCGFGIKYYWKFKFKHFDENGIAITSYTTFAPQRWTMPNNWKKIGPIYLIFLSAKKYKNGYVK